jgi:PAS domain S-box-containing protein
MTAESKTIELLTAEIRNLRQRVAELEAWKSRHEWVLEAYKQSESKFKSLAENSVAGVCIIQDGLFKYANAKLAGIFGYTVDELVDRVPAKALVLHEDWPMVEENISLRICGKTEAIGYQFSGIKKDGEVIRVDVHGSCVDHKGAPAVMGTLLDITQRIRTEAELEKEVNKFRGLYDLAVAMTADNNLNENLSMVVEQSRKLLGFDASYIALRDEQAGDVYMHTLSGITTEAFKRMRLPFGSGLGGKVAATQKGVVVSDYFQQVESPVYDIVRAEGLISGIAVPIQIGRTNLGVLYGFNRTKTSFSQSDLDTLFLIGNLAAVEITHKRQKIDLLKARDDLEQKVQDRTAKLSAANEHLKQEIIDREKAENALRGSEAMLRSVLSTSPVGIGLSEDRIMKWANEAWLEMFGFENEHEVVGQSARMIYPSDAEYERVGQILYESLQTGRVTSADATCRRKDGSLLDAHVRMKSFGLSDLNTGSLAVISDISERKRVERALRESEQRYRALVENSLTGICVHQHGVHVYVNERYAKDLGYSADELIGKSMLEVVAPQDREMVEQIWLDRIAGKKVPSQYQLKSLKKDGSVRWGEVWSTVIEHNGSPAILANVIDITKRKQAEGSLRALLDFRQTLIDSIPNPVFYKDIHHKYIGCNEAFTALVGLSREQVVGKSVHEVVPKELADLWSEKDQELLGRAHVQVFEFTMRTPDGTERTLVNHKAPFLDGDGQLAGLIGVMVDITDRKSMERALRESEERYRAIFNNAAVGITVADGYGKFIKVNSAASKMLGYAPQELESASFSDITHPDDVDISSNNFGALIQGEIDSYRIEKRYIRKDGEIVWVDLSVSAILDEKGVCVATFGMAVDITERKRAEQERKSLREQLLQAQKMEAIGTLAGGIAHDFNNMLTIILGYSELIQSETDAQDPRSADLAKIVQTAKKGADLVQRLLTFSRKADMESGPLELNGEIERTRKLLERTLPKMIDIRLNLEDKLALINADPIQIDQVLMNLAINARDAMPDGGKLIIETRNVTLDEDYCSTHMGVMPGKYVMLSISDTGHGMNDITRARIFEPFFSTKHRDSAKGTGLGLAVVHGIVEQHSGHIICESEPDKGCTFRIYFPAVDRVTIPKDSVVNPLSNGRGETLLLVDDEEFVRDLGKRILRRAGYKVITASNGKEALEIYGKARGEIKLVILDLLMPEMGGKECLRELHKIEPELKIVVASGFSSTTSVDESAELGARAFVSKPFRIEELLHQVRRILDDR